MKSVKLDDKEVFPSKIVCIGRNYIEHIRELDSEVPSEPVIFMKPNSSISEHIYSDRNELIHYEGEITFLVHSGRLSAVGFGLDLTKRQLQFELKKKGLPWERCKAFDRSAVFSEFVTYEGDIRDLSMELLINGKLVQQAGYDLMLNKPDSILSEARSFFTLENNDLIMTGTPKGVGPIEAGDSFLGKIYCKDTLLVEGSWVAK